MIDPQVKLKQLENQILDTDIALMLVQFSAEVMKKSFEHKSESITYNEWARRIVAHAREHIS